MKKESKYDVAGQGTVRRGEARHGGGKARQGIKSKFKWR